MAAAAAVPVRVRVRPEVMADLAVVEQGVTEPLSVWMARPIPVAVAAVGLIITRLSEHREPAVQEWLLFVMLCYLKLM